MCGLCILYLSYRPVSKGREGSGMFRVAAAVVGESIGDFTYTIKATSTSTHKYSHHTHPPLRHQRGTMSFSSCPGCRYDEHRKQERAERRRQNTKSKNSKNQRKPTLTVHHSDSLDSGEESDEWETDEEQEDDFTHMIDTFMSRASMYTRAMRGVIEMDKENGKQTGKVLTRGPGGSAGDKWMGHGMGNKNVGVKGKGKQAESGTASSSRTQGDENGSLMGAGVSGPSSSGSGGVASSQPKRRTKMTLPKTRYSLDETD
ncbi:hypothetical protein D9756_003040 [Leucocoprinus leucothites]|uniref:Uncharacterized protein n=1 Tax=Leucocoprinus leucothites TaxID=201217 RepID=A0A8H5LJR2_9AGAR|nr:hypothetical protein D9756_003040 [Leucoagaricus leucothites]